VTESESVAAVDSDIDSTGAATHRTVIIIGGGVAGLGAAYKIRRAADAGHDVSFILVEKDDRLGGKLATDHIEDPKGRGTFIVDGGSDSFLTDKPAVHRVAKQLGIFEHETGTLDENKKTFIVKGGKLVEMPDGIMMFAPTKIIPMATTKLYSWPAKFRMALDLVIPPKKIAPGERNDESLESFVVRRMGQECLDRLAEPLVGGVNGSDPKEMSLAATYPMLLDMEQQHGSLVKGFLAQKKKVEEMKRKYPPKPGAKRRTFFSSFEPGLQFLTDSLADAAGRNAIRTGATATGIARGEDGGWCVTLEGGEVLAGDAVIVASEAWATAPLVAGVDDRVGELVASIPCSSSATILMGFEAEDCPFDKRWHGILSPAVEHQPVTGISLMSSKWPGRAPEGCVLMRGFVGGPRDQEIIKRPDEELVEIARTSFVELLGVKTDAKPLFARVYRWVGGMPQYTLGHLDRVEELEQRCATIPGFALAGGAYRGVGVPNCLDSGEKAVSKVLGEWGVALDEDAQEHKRLY
jgi:protoporphyrinogen/coproporphyrinogen III oxidase